MVWRRLRIAADTSLAALHFIFQIVQGWGDDHLHQFHIYGKDYGISYEGGIGFVDNPFRVVIDDFAFDAGDRFTYEYNFFEHWLHDIRVEAIYENSTLKAPFCISGHGMPGATAADEFIDRNLNPQKTKKAPQNGCFFNTPCAPYERKRLLNRMTLIDTGYEWRFFAPFPVKWTQLPLCGSQPHTCCRASRSCIRTSSASR